MASNNPAAPAQPVRPPRPVPRLRPAWGPGPDWAPRLSRSPWLPAVALGVSALLLVAAASAGPNSHFRGERLVIALVVCSPVLLLRRWSLVALAATTVANVLLAVTDAASLPFGVLLGFASYLVASQLPRRVTISAAAASATFLGGALLYAELAHLEGPIAAGAVESFLPLVAGWFTGDSMAARRRYLAGLAEQAERERAAQADRARQQVCAERVRIAREMHDVVAHTLAVMTVQAGVGRRLMDRRPQEAATALASIEAIGRTAQDELRVVLGLLREEDDGTAPLIPAPRLTDTKDLIETIRASGTPVDLYLSGTDRPLSPALELSVYRVLQEALTNVVKHAPGARATVELAVGDNEIRLDVTDDGAPALPAAARPATAPGHGIVGMRERMAAFGGRLTAEPLAGRGFRVSARVPM